MELADDIQLIGIESVVLDADAGVLRLRLVASDGSVCACHWKIEAVREFVSVVAPARLNLMGISAH